jgi:hypothetical protein
MSGPRFNAAFYAAPVEEFLAPSPALGSLTNVA